MGKSKELTETEVEVLINTIDYTLGTIVSPSQITTNGNTELIGISAGRAFQAQAFLRHARQILTQ